MSPALIHKVEEEQTPEPFPDVFQLAPIPLWLEDWSGVHALLARWRTEGVGDLRAFLAADLSRVRQSSELIRILEVNRSTLELFEARDTAHLLDNLGTAFQDALLETHLEELVQLWEGELAFTSRAVNHSLSGRRLDVQMKGRVLPGHEHDWSRLLVAAENVTALEEARRRLAESDAYAKGLFDHSPVSLWVEDFTEIRKLLEEVRNTGVSEFRAFLDRHPDFVKLCMSRIRVVEVNRQTLLTLGAPDRETLLARLDEVFREALVQPFAEELVDLWNGRLVQSREVVNYSLAGEELHFVMQLSVLPGHEDDWALVQVALTDITARKKAETYLEYLGKHDVLTKLFNRSFYVDELNRIERRRVGPISVLMADLNGLKVLNDALGHAVGDTLLRRAGEVFAEAVALPWHAARIGGDEFAVLMPGAGAADAEALGVTIDELCELNNQFYPGEPLSLAIGVATAHPGERLEEVVKRADLAMYAAKRRFYESGGRERRAS